MTNNSSYVAGGFLSNMFGMTTINNSTLTGNSSGSASFTEGGGAIWNQSGTVMMTGDTLANNAAYEHGGAVCNNQNLTISNCTIYDNSITGSNTTTYRGGGVYSSSEPITLTSDTIYGNTAGEGGGIFVGSTLTGDNDIIAGNSAGTDPDVKISSGSTLNYSLIGNTTGNTITSSTSNVTDVSAGLAATLGSNGGPTQTLALLPTSAAINGGGSSWPPDQRGIMPARRAARHRRLPAGNGDLQHRQLARHAPRA